MLNCSVLRGMPVGFGAPSGSISSGLPLMSATAFSKSATALRELPDGDVAVAAMPIEARVVGVAFDAL